MDTDARQAAWRLFVSKAAFIALVCTFFAGAAFAADEAGSGSRDADNTGKNVRDRGDDTLTPLDQSNKPEDRDLTAKIRKALVDDDSLSTNAQNVKVITIDRVVTLRGPVKSPEERVAVEAKARSVGGMTRIVNQIEVERN